MPSKFTPGKGIVTLEDDCNYTSFMIPQIKAISLSMTKIIVWVDAIEPFSFDFLNEDQAQMTYHLILSHIASQR